MNQMEKNSNQQRKFKILSFPVKPQEELQTLFTDVVDSIKKKLETPNVIRPGGWSLETRNKAVIEGGGRYIVVEGLKKRVELYRNGTLFLECLADKNFLAWSSEDGLKINPLALIELVYNFMDFYKEVLNDFKKKPQEFCVRFSFVNLHLNNQKTYIVPGALDAIPIYGEIPAQKNNFSSQGLSFSTENYDTGKITYKIVKEIYAAVFGVFPDEGKIPYVKKDENNNHYIDAKEIREIR